MKTYKARFLGVYHSSQRIGHVTFSGTQRGMNAAQMRQGIMFLTQHHNHIRVLHHGCCEGADGQFHWLTRTYFPKIKIWGHPSNIADKTLKETMEDCDFLSEPEEPLVRNKNMVDVSRKLVLAPHQDKEILRSGTWATFRYAKESNLTIYQLECDFEQRRYFEIRDQILAKKAK